MTSAGSANANQANATTQEWTAPAVERSDFPMVAGERAALEHMLDWYRETLLWKCAGLTGRQLARRAARPSSLSLLGIVRHLADVERSWFVKRVGGADVPFLFKTASNNDADFDDVDGSGAGAEEAFRAFDEEIAAARAEAAAHELDETFTSTTRAGDELTYDLRWLYLHMIEEYARHLGHADLLRERIDGVVGA